MKWIVKIINKEEGTTRHKLYKTEKGARKGYYCYANEKGVRCELYKEVSARYSQQELDLTATGMYDF